MKRYSFFIIFGVCGSLFCTAGQIELGDMGARVHEKMPLLLGVIGQTSELKKISAVIKKDLEFSNQFVVRIKKVKPVTEVQQIKSWFSQGYPLIIYLSDVDDQALSWRLYDTADASMLRGKKVQKCGTIARGWAHNVADEIWPALMGVPGFFSTKIVYGKGSSKRGKQSKKFLYIRDATDLEGSTEQQLVASPTISVSPRWNRDLKRPLVLYSEYAKTNVRLIAVDMNSKRCVVSNFDGVNMQATYSTDGTKVIYCLSRSPKPTMAQHFTSQLYHYSYDKEKKKDSFKRLTTNQANNFSPCWGPGNTVFYASDAFSKKAPDICWLDLDTNKLSWITQGCYAVCPAYTSVTNKLAYCKMVKQKMQLFSYDLASRIHTQLTFDRSNKEDCSWSPCGNFITYSVEREGKSRLAVYNLLTAQQQWMTPESQDCSYPSWSPSFEEFPVVYG